MVWGRGFTDKQEEDGVDLGECELIKMSEKALYLKLEDGDQRWVPKSVVMDGLLRLKNPGDQADVTVKEWWAEKEELP